MGGGSLDHSWLDNPVSTHRSRAQDAEGDTPAAAGMWQAASGRSPMLRTEAGPGSVDERGALLGELEDLLGRLAALQEPNTPGDGIVELPSDPAFDPPVTWTTDRELRYSSARGSLDRGSAEAAPALVGRPLWEYLGTADPNHPLLRYHRRALDGETVFFRVRWRDRIWFTHVAPLRGERKVTGTIGFAFEVGIAGDALAARRASARRYRAVVSSAPVGVAVLGLDGQVLECNPALARILDYEPDEIRRRGVAGLSHPDDLMLDVQLFAELVEGKRDRYQIEKRYFRRDGSMVWCNLTVSLVRGERGVPELVVSIIEDVSERNRTLEALRESEARFRSVYESGMVGIFFFDEDLVIRDANDAFVKMVGYERPELAARVRWTDITPTEFAPRDAHAVAELARDGICAPYEKEYRRKDQTRIAVVAGGALLDPQRRQGVSFVLDVSERRRLEAQFQQAQRLDVLGRLAGGVAHDFNSIVTAVLVNADLVRTALDLDHPAQSDLAEIREAGLRASQLTRQLLAFSRAQLLQPRVFDIDELVRRVDRLLRRVIREDIEIVTDLQASEARVKADPNEIERALMNLVINARDALPGPGRITIATRRVDPVDPRGLRGEVTLHGPCVSIAVTDDGTGMDPETTAHMFEPFFTTKELGSGTGLGLSIVYGVVQQSGGALRVESAPGAGTTFEILLPESADDVTDEVQTPVPTPTAGGETILVADDDPMVVRAASNILRARSYRVLVAQTAAEAL